MAVMVRKASRAHIGSIDFSDHIPDVMVDSSVETAGITCIGDTARKYAAGMALGKMDFTILDDYAAGETDISLNMIDTITSGVPMRESVPCSVAIDPVPLNGSGVYMLTANEVNHNKQWTIGDLAKVTVNMLGANEILRGAYISGTTGGGGVPETTISSASASTGVQLGGLGLSQKLFAFLHYTTGSSPSGITVTVQHCATQGGSYVTTNMSTSAFSTLTGTSGYQILIATATSAITDTWWRISWTFTSGSATVVCPAGIKTVIGV